MDTNMRDLKESFLNKGLEFNANVANIEPKRVQVQVSSANSKRNNGIDLSI